MPYRMLIDACNPILWPIHVFRQLWDWDLIGSNDFLGAMAFPLPFLGHNAMAVDGGKEGWFKLLDKKQVFLTWAWFLAILYGCIAQLDAAPRTPV